ncbi:MAG: extracellular solute-binding protein [Anaerolineae bacterium]|nr:extracellular solute-binding protein [Anaerolineae bacterium]
MKRKQPAIFIAVLAGILCSLGLFSVGCATSATPEPTATPTSLATELSLNVTPEPVLTPTPVSPAAPQEITIWITELVSPLEEKRQSQIFEQHIVAFQATHPDLTIEILRKKRDGKGGIRDFLTSASAVAPAVVPDLIALDTKTLVDMGREGLLVPLDGLLSPALLDDLYPFATQSCMIDQRLFCVQFQANVEHAVYYTSKIAVAPLTWDEVFASGATYIFPTAGQDGLVNDAFLIQYLSTGAEFVDGSGKPALDQQALTDVLSFYRQGIDSGVILSDSLNYQRVEDCWPKYLQAEVVISNLSSNLYLAGRSLLEPVSVVTSIPTRDGQFVMLTQGYAWAITAHDPDRWPTVVQLLEWLMYPANLAEWNRAAGHLPTRRSAFEQMTRDTYVKFMYSQLENARPYPSLETHQRIYYAMQVAIDDVLRKNIPPSEAAIGILNAVGQEASPQ